jgi:hypothetical protein
MRRRAPKPTAEDRQRERDLHRERVVSNEIQLFTLRRVQSANEYMDPTAFKKWLALEIAQVFPLVEKRRLP